MTGAFHRASHHSLKSSLVRKLSKARLKSIIVIVQRKTEIVQSMHINQSAVRIIGETASK